MSIVVPLAHDKITLKDGGKRIVLSYTNMKDDPAVYVENPEGRGSEVVFFEDIAAIRGVKVDYLDGPKVFKAYGTVRRKIQLPQIGDSIDVATAVGEEELSKIVEVKEYKLHNKSVGLSKGLAMCSDRECFTLEQIFSVEYADGGGRFDRSRFLKYYSDYTPFDFKV